MIDFYHSITGETYKETWDVEISYFFTIITFGRLKAKREKEYYNKINKR